MTTNAGSNTRGGGLGFGQSINELSRDKALKALNEFLRPEFINRVDEIVHFNHLTEDNFRAIARLMLGEMEAVMSAKAITLEYDDALVDYLVKRSFSETYGARNLRRTIQKEIEDVVAAKIVDELRGKASRVSLTSDGEKIVVAVE